MSDVEDNDKKEKLRMLVLHLEPELSEEKRDALKRLERIGTVAVIGVGHTEAMMMAMHLAMMHNTHDIVAIDMGHEILPHHLAEPRPVQEVMILEARHVIPEIEDISIHVLAKELCNPKPKMQHHGLQKTRRMAGKNAPPRQGKYRRH